jgi:hypothetical protein
VRAADSQGEHFKFYKEIHGKLRSVIKDKMVTIEEKGMWEKGHDLFWEGWESTLCYLQLSTQAHSEIRNIDKELLA